MQWKISKQLKFLSDAAVIRIATIGKTNRPQVTPVCHVVWRGNIYWCSDLDAVKLKNLEHHRWVALVADEYRANWRKMGGVEARGKARIVRDGRSSARSAIGSTRSSRFTSRLRRSKRGRARS